jgi:hypothetical protein
MRLQRATLGATWATDMLRELQYEAQYRLDPLIGHRMMRTHAAGHLNYMPDLKTPKTYNEKILWRKAFDRNPAFPVVQDKVSMPK